MLVKSDNFLNFQHMFIIFWLTLQVGSAGISFIPLCRLIVSESPYEISDFYFPEKFWRSRFGAPKYFFFFKWRLVMRYKYLLVTRISEINFAKLKYFIFFQCMVFETATIYSFENKIYFRKVLLKDIFLAASKWFRWGLIDEISRNSPALGPGYD